MVDNIKFGAVKDPFLSTLSNDAKKIRASTNVMTFADKTRNIYEMKPKKYNQLLTDNITKNYKLSNDLSLKEINHESKSIANTLKIDERIECMAQSQAFISLKDHKENFENNPKCRLINPAKSELGKISKIILDRINNDIRSSSRVNQWRSSTAVIEWFKAINEKNKHTFISFDIVDFYPSISEELLDKAISWASERTQITDQDISIIKHARKSLLFNDGRPSVKRNSLIYV